MLLPLKKIRRNRQLRGKVPTNAVIDQLTGHAFAFSIQHNRGVGD
jgi:hypothetical protein